LRSKVQKEIMRIITNILYTRPVTIQDLEDRTDFSNSLIHRHVTELTKSGLLEKQQVNQPKGRSIAFYQLAGKTWPKHLGKKCGDCHNFNSKTSCTFYEEIDCRGSHPKYTQEKITKDTYTCYDGFIPRKRNWYRMRLEKFLARARKVTETEKGLLITYHCLRKDCKAELTTLGNAWIARLGSSVVRCKECDSFYKMLYIKKRNAFYVNYNLEKGIEYKRNFQKLTKEKEPEELYSSERHGVVVHDLRDCIINWRTRTLIVNNYVGKLPELKYIVANRRDDYEELLDLIPSRGYDIDIILGEERLVSPPPIKQLVGLLQLLREGTIANKDFCLPMLENRIMFTIEVGKIFGEEKEQKIRKAVKEIRVLINAVKEKQTVTPDEWNFYEMRAGNEMWGVVKHFLKREGIPFPGRGKCRLVEDPSLPHRKAYAYSEIDTLINGVFGINGDLVKEYCCEINFCWDGYPGINHGITKRGIFAFHFDMKEPEKLLPVLVLLEAIRDGELTTKEVRYFRGKHREKVYYLEKETELFDKLTKITEEAQKRVVNGKKMVHIVREHFRGGQQWLKDLQRRSSYYEVTHHGIDYQPWAIIKEKVWNVLPKTEKIKLLKFLKQEHQQIGFKPFQIWEIN